MNLIRHWINYKFNVAKRFLSAWDAVWFAPLPSMEVSTARVALGIAVVLYSLSWVPSLHSWISAESALPSELARYLIGDGIEGTGSGGRISVLYLKVFESLAGIYAFLTAILCGACVLGIGGRVTVILSWLLLLGIVHRVPMLEGPGDILLLTLFGYLCIDPGKLKTPFRVGGDDGESRWTARLALTAMQVHVWGWLLVSFVSHLSEEMWWIGDAAWALASHDLTNGFTVNTLAGHPYVVNVITHGFLLVHLLVLMLLPWRFTRPLGFAFLLVLAGYVFVLSSDCIYAMALAAAASVFYISAKQEVLSIK